MSPQENPESSRGSEAIPQSVGTKLVVKQSVQDTLNGPKFSEKVPEGMSMIVRIKNPNEPHPDFLDAYQPYTYEVYPSGTIIPEDKESCLIPEIVNFCWKPNKYYNESMTFSASKTSNVRILGILMEHPDEQDRALALHAGIANQYHFSRVRGMCQPDSSALSFDPFYILQTIGLGIREVKNLTTGEIFTEIDHSRGAK